MFHELDLFKLKVIELGIKSSLVEVSNNKMKIEATGNNFKETKDEGFFAFKLIEGDFDISVKVNKLSPTNLYAMAGIMARSDLSKKSPHVFFHVFPNNSPKNRNNGGCELIYRTEETKEVHVIYPDGNVTGNKFNVYFPDTWIRLKRRGNVFKSYISNDNTNWNIYSMHNQQLPEKLLVGIAVSSNSDDISVDAEFENLEITWE